MWRMLLRKKNFIVSMIFIIVFTSVFVSVCTLTETCSKTDEDFCTKQYLDCVSKYLLSDAPVDECLPGFCQCMEVHKCTDNCAWKQNCGSGEKCPPRG